MTETMLSESTTALVVNFLYYLLFTGHICLFVDSSRFQKYPISRFNHIVASMLSALLSTTLVNTISFSSTTTELVAGASLAVVSSTGLTLVIQRIIKIDMGS